jgi:hypothetical protein
MVEPNTLIKTAVLFFIAVFLSELWKEHRGAQQSEKNSHPLNIHGFLIGMTVGK